MKKYFLFAAMSSTIYSFSQNRIELHPQSAKDTISRHIYGHFAEHLGRGIYGGIYVGEGNQKIPNKDGVRMDVIEALKKLKIPNLRWPGGCFADTYQWKEGIGPKKDRPSILNVWWGNVKEDNSFGTHEFLNMCELLGAEPYLGGNVGSGSVKDLADWVKYVNFKAGTGPMADLRQKYGRTKPWNVKFWGIGNEAWGCGGNMKPEYYANVYRQYATFMTDWGNSDKLYRIASGASDNDYHWTEVLMRDIPHNMLSAVALHHYSVLNWSKKGPSTTFTEEQYFTTLEKALQMDEFIQKHKVIMDKYDPAKKVDLIVDEWGGWYEVEPGTNGAFLYQQNTMRDAMIAGVTLNIFNNHCDRVKMANLAQAVNVLQAVILTDEEKMILTPTYHVMEMYNAHHDALLLPLSVKSEEYVVGKSKLPAISASASRDKAGVVHISLVNIDARHPKSTSIDLKGLKAASVSGKILTSGKLQDHNTFTQPNKVTPTAFKGAVLKDNVLNITLPPFSVVVLTLE
jgi:alpha-L-arabinofuranosidase